MKIKFLWIILALFSPLLPIVAYFSGNWYSLFHSYSLGMVFGIISYIYFLNCLILSARVKLFDRLFGQDKVIRFHASLAILALLSAALHLYFKKIYFPESNFQIYLGYTAFYIFLLVIVITLLLMVTTKIHQFTVIRNLKTLLLNKLKIDYSHIKLFHNFASVGVVLIAIHVYLASPTREGNLRSGMMGAWAFISIGLYIHHKFLRPLRVKNNQFKVVDVQLLNDSVTELNLHPERKKTKYKPGQFGYFRIISPVCSKEEHPFTISSSPNEENLTLTIKTLGDYTENIRNLQSGAKVFFDGPYGKFYPNNLNHHHLFIAGGIGITPFLSIISHWSKEKITTPATLLWSTKYSEDLTHRVFFESIEKSNPHFKFIPIVTRQNHTSHTLKRITAELLSKIIENPSKTEVFLCGPEPMSTSLMEHLKKLNIKKYNIHFEKFSL
ncbi:FAD-binding oxidoreductase [Chitinispirillales bacterium ANBcel5]|uniref:ferredoxin reductase family protein n=1 Tax=Cellulosispirillum alkaliphilum TaxID=3039283 RepID=UPI002A50115A|nr:FAD-binding oxidoreductase [Chitinispirillales bacterium ANBcel5]